MGVLSSGMPKRSSTRPSSEHGNETTVRVVREATRDHDAAEPPETPAPREKNPAAVALGRLGGKKGGKARAAKLSPERRADIARTAARKRWQKRDHAP